MKIYIIGVVLSLAVLVSPTLTQAQTTTLTSAQIDSVLSLLQSFGADQSTINNVETALNGGTQTPSGQFCYNFTSNLSIGISDSVVTELQTALQNDGESVTINGTFDDQTASAVTGFQEKYASDILTPNGLQHGTGYVGLSTRAKLNALYGCGVITPTSWKTYTNSQYGFEFKYPVEKYTSPASLVFNAVPTGCQNLLGGNCNNPSRYDVSVSRCFAFGGECANSSTFEVEVFSDLNEFAGVKSRTGDTEPFRKVSDVQVGGVPGQRVDVGGTQFYFVTLGLYGYMIRVDDISGQKNVPADEMSKIFSTFKFNL
jgi:hypothetical protein